jgi:hypothetical protein
LVILIILGENTRYEAPPYVVFSNLLSLHPSSVQIFSSAPCSQAPSVYVYPLMSETTGKIIVLYILFFTCLDSADILITEKKTFPGTTLIFSVQHLNFRVDILEALPILKELLPFVYLLSSF